MARAVSRLDTANEERSVAAGLADHYDVEMSAPDRPQVLELMRLLTIRLEKGGKDKLQALLVIAENAEDRDFGEDLARLLGAFGADRIDDAIGDAQAALLAVSTDVQVAGPQAAGYAAMHRRLEAGFAALMHWAGLAEPPA
jgi:hypothetical protein